MRKPAAAPSAVAALMQDDTPGPSPDKLEALRAGARRCRDLALEIEEMEERVSELRAQLRALQDEQLVDLMDAAGVRDVTLEREGNNPAIKFEVKPYYAASVKTDGPRAQEAFAWLRAHGMGDLIKNVVSVPFGMGDDKKAASLVKHLEKSRIDYERKISVPHQSLTASLREMIEKHGATLSPEEMDLLGARVGRTVKQKPLKE